MQTQNNETTTQNALVVNQTLINANLGFIKSVANNIAIKDDLVSSIFFDYLNAKNDYKAEMVTLKFSDINNKSIAKFYFSRQVQEVAKSLFNEYGVEIKETDKGYTLINSKKTSEADNIIKGAKEYLRNCNTLEAFISVNNLKLRVKLINFRTLKDILNHLTTEINGVTVKALINGIDANLFDKEYLNKLNAIIKEAKALTKKETALIFDFSKIKSVEEVTALIEELKALKDTLNGAKVPTEEMEEVTTGEIVAETYEIQE